MDTRDSSTELMRTSLPWISARISRVRRAATISHLARSHRSSSPRDSGCGSYRKLHSLIRGCRTVQRDTAGRILIAWPLSVSDQDRVFLGVAVLSFAIVGWALLLRMTFLFPHSDQTRNQIIDNKMLILLGRCSENLLDAQFIAVILARISTFSSTFSIFFLSYNSFQLQFDIIDIIFSRYSHILQFLTI